MATLNSGERGLVLQQLLSKIVGIMRYAENLDNLPLYHKLASPKYNNDLWLNLSK